MKLLLKWSKNHFFLVILLAITLLSSLYYYTQLQKTQKELADLKKNPTVAAQNENNALIAKVGQLVVLPTGETPTIATVSDISKLKNQPFFSKAENGDKILIYTQAKKAYLYSVGLNKILDVAPVNIGAQGNSPQVAGESTGPAKN